MEVLEVETGVLRKGEETEKTEEESMEPVLGMGSRFF